MDDDATTTNAGQNRHLSAWPHRVVARAARSPHCPLTEDSIYMRTEPIGALQTSPRSRIDQIPPCPQSDLGLVLLSPLATFEPRPLFRTVFLGSTGRSTGLLLALVLDTHLLVAFSLGTHGDVVVTFLDGCLLTVFKVPLSLTPG